MNINKLVTEDLKFIKEILITTLTHHILYVHFLKIFDFFL